MMLENYRFNTIKNQKNEIFIKMCIAKSDQKVVAFTASHPFKTHLLSNIYYSFTEFFLEKKCIQVFIKDQEKPVFVKIADLAIQKGIIKPTIQKLWNCCFISDNALIAKYQLMDDFGIPEASFEDAMLFFTTVAANLFNFVLSKHKILPADLTQAVCQLGKAIRLKKTFYGNTSSFSYSHLQGFIEFKFIEPTQLILYELTTMGQKTLLINNSQPENSFLEKDSSSSRFTTALKQLPQPRKTKTKAAAVDPILQKLYEDEGLMFDGLEHVVKIIKPENIINLAASEYSNTKKRFLNAILKINALLKKQTFWKTLVGKELEYKAENDKHLGFALNKKKVIIVGEKFAEGSFKGVSSAHILNTMQKIVEIKIEKSNQDDIIKSTEDEKKLLDKMAKSNTDLIPPYKWVFKSSNKQTLVMFHPYFEGNGQEFIGASPWHLFGLFQVVSRGLAKMHQDNYIHSDIKPENILFNGKIEEESQIEIKIADIGMAQKIKRPLKGGTPFYLPPEVFTDSGSNEGVKADPKIDSYSLGVTMLEFFQVITESDACPALQSDQINQKIKRLQNDAEINSNLFPFEKMLLVEMLDLAKGLLVQDPLTRLSCKEVSDKLNKLGL